MEIIPTNTCPPNLAELVRRTEEFSAYASVVQLDVADGVFVPARSWPYAEGQWAELEALAESEDGLPQSKQLVYEVHIMAQKPQKIGEALARAGIKRIIGHREVFEDANEAQTALDAWRKAGAQEVGLALLLDTPLSALGPLAQVCDVVQLMSIGKLGYQGAAFEPRIFDRIRELHAAHQDLIIEIDGGVSAANIAELAKAGARRFGVGSAISKAPDPRVAYEALATLAENAILAA